MLAQKLYHRFFGNQVICIFWVGLMAIKKFSFASVPLPLRMVQRFGSGKIGGFVTPHFENSIPHCIILFVTKAIPSLRFWRLLRQM
jgi:hypothetical protein